jgi:hypothetical protein
MLRNLASKSSIFGRTSFFYMPQSWDMGQIILLPLRRKACGGFLQPEKSDGFGRARTRDLGYQRAAFKPLNNPNKREGQKIPLVVNFLIEMKYKQHMHTVRALNLSPGPSDNAYDNKREIQMHTGATIQQHFSNHGDKLWEL